MPDQPTEANAQEELMPQHDEIAMVAYSYWQSRGCPDGHDVEDWLMAEQEVLLRRSPKRQDLRKEARTAA